jgi:gliding motility-associated-like protein
MSIHFFIKNMRFKIWFILIFCTWFQQNLIANDPCTAIPVANNGVLFTTYNLSTQGGSGVNPPLCGTYNDPDIWFSFVAPAGGSVTIEIKGITATDPAMAIYTGACGSPDIIGCYDDQYCGTVPNPGVSLTGLTQGATYYIRVWNELPGGGTFKMRVLNPNQSNFNNQYNAYNTSPNCIQMTQEAEGQRGCSWYNAPLDFDDAFEIEFNLYFGDIDANGADGICLVFSTAQNCGGVGGGIGAAGIPNSLIIEFDTWDNGTSGYDDIPEDHTSIHANGDFSTSIAGPVALPNIEDGVEHPARILWDPATQTITVYLDGAPVISLTGYDIINNCFNGNNEIYWGWTASTGGSFNNQYFCYESAVINNTAAINEELFITLCNGESYTSPNGNVFSTTGIYTEDFVASNGCNSVRTMNVDVFPQEIKLINTTICKGDAFNYNGSSYSSPGDYTVTVDGIPCDTIVNLHVDLVDFFVSAYKLNDIDCNNSTAQLSADYVDQSAPLFGGTVNLEWLTNDGNIISGQGTNQIIVDKAGTYWLRITTSNGLACDFISNYVTVLDNTQPPNAFIKPLGTLDCSHTSIVLDGTLSTPGGITFTWSTVNGNIVGSDIGSTILIDKPGDYTLIIENLATGCKDTTTYTAKNTAFDASAILSKTSDLNCATTLVDISAVITNGNNTTILWKTANGHIVGDSTGTKIQVDKSGIYTIIISDNNGCKVDFSINVTQNTTPPTISAGPDTLITCKHPNLTVTGQVFSPNSHYKASWQELNNGFNSDSLHIQINQEGNYILTVLDSTNHCINKDTVTVGLSKNPPSAAPYPHNSFTCGIDSILLKANISGYKPSFTFHWTSNNINFSNNYIDSLVYVLDTGIYEITIIDTLNGCSSLVSFDVNGSQDQPVAQAGKDEVLDCILPFITHTGGFVSTQPNEIAIKWSTTNGSIVGPDDKLQINISTSGTYILTVINLINNCESKDTIQVSSNSDKPIVTIEENNILTCANPQLTLIPHWTNAGSNPTVLWSTVDGNILNSVNDSLIQVNLKGEYILTITNPQNGCKSLFSVNVGENKIKPSGSIPVPSPLNCIVTQTDILFNQSSQNYIYQWSTLDGVIVGSTINNSIIAGSKGRYNVLVTDTTNGCSSNFSQDVISDTNLPNVSAGTAQDLNCKTSYINLNGTVNNATNFSINWTTGSSGNITSGQTTLTPTVDKAGSYIIHVTNNDNGCSNTDTVIVMSKITNPQFVNPTVTAANCFGKNGSIRFESIKNGDGPYIFQINNVTINPNNLNFNNLDAGSYLIEGEDVNGCTFSYNTTINPSDGISFILPDTVEVEYGQSYLIVPEFLFDTTGMHYNSWLGADYFSCNPCLYPTIYPTYNAVVSLAITDKDGCPDEEQLFVRVFKKENKVFVPNIFSPDNNGINDKVTVFADSDVITSISEFRIFNRWGAEVFLKKDFQPNDENLGWDGRFKGKACNPDVYIYFAKVKNIYGEEIIYKGSITIMN